MALMIYIIRYWSFFYSQPLSVVLTTFAWGKPSVHGVSQHFTCYELTENNYVNNKLTARIRKEDYQITRMVEKFLFCF